jgi:hypothetical protein
LRKLLILYGSLRSVPCTLCTFAAKGGEERLVATMLATVMTVRKPAIQD